MTNDGLISVAFSWDIDPKDIDERFDYRPEEDKEAGIDPPTKAELVWRMATVPRVDEYVEIFTYAVPDMGLL